jgi:HEPN domain-containing protein
MKGSVYDTQKITDAERRKDAAKERLEHNDNAGCIRESQAAVELAVKALLELLDIEYPLDHDMSGQIPKAIKKLEQALIPEKAYWIRNDLSRTAVTSRFLSSVKEYTVYGLQDAGIPAGTMFLELGNFAKECLQQTEAVVFRLGKLIRELLDGSLQQSGTS